MFQNTKIFQTVVSLPKPEIAQITNNKNTNRTHWSNE